MDKISVAQCILYLAPGCGLEPDWWSFRAKGQDYCYYISKESDQIQKNWHDARDYCMSKGGNLVSIHGRREHSMVTGLVGTSSINNCNKEEITTWLQAW